MSEKTASVRYVLLKGADSCVQGHVRLETSASDTKVTLQADGCKAGCPLRILMVSCGEDRAVLDLGSAVASADGAARENHSLPPMNLRHWDAVALAEDWPSGRLTASGWLTGQTGALWRLQEAAGRYLAVPPAYSTPLQDVVASH